MKKLIATTAAIMLLAGGASAAAINWGNSALTKITGLGGEAITSANYSTYNLVISLVDASTDATVQTASTIGSKSGYLAGEYNYAFDVDHTTGDQFYIKATMTYSGTDYFFFIGSNGAVGDAVSATPWAIAATDPTGSDTFEWNTTSTYGGSTWVPVPEPATAALALAGLAMLIRRRK
jgi:hypothetical protein